MDPKEGKSKEPKVTDWIPNFLIAVALKRLTAVDPALVTFSFSPQVLYIFRLTL